MPANYILLLRLHTRSEYTHAIRVRIHGAAQKSSVTASVQMIQTILILVEHNGKKLSFFPPVFKISIGSDR